MPWEQAYAQHPEEYDKERTEKRTGKELFKDRLKAIRKQIGGYRRSSFRMEFSIEAFHRQVCCEASHCISDRSTRESQVLPFCRVRFWLLPFAICKLGVQLLGMVRFGEFLTDMIFP